LDNICLVARVVEYLNTYTKKRVGGPGNIAHVVWHYSTQLIWPNQFDFCCQLDKMSVENIIHNLRKYSSLSSLLGVVASLMILANITIEFTHTSAIYGSIISGVAGSIIPAVVAFIILEKVSHKFLFNKISELKIDIKNKLIENARNAIAHRYEEPSVFIAYTDANREMAKKLLKDLSETHINTFTWENSINIGDNIPEKINTLLNQSNYFIFLISKDTIKSEYLDKELKYAISQNKKILPVLVTENAEIPKEIKDIKYVSGYKNYYIGLEEIMKTIYSDLDKRKNDVASNLE